MRKIALLALLAMVAGSAPAFADEYDDSQSHPLRIAAYLVHPLGYALEWALFRPFHWVVSQEGLEEVFGHKPHGGEVGADVPSV